MAIHRLGSELGFMMQQAAKMMNGGRYGKAISTNGFHHSSIFTICIIANKVLLLEFSGDSPLIFANPYPEACFFKIVDICCVDPILYDDLFKPRKPVPDIWTVSLLPVKFYSSLLPYSVSGMPL